MSNNLTVFSRLVGCFIFLWFFNPTWAQETISGKVTDESDNGDLPGVNVLVKATTTGTVTDADGNYQLSIAEDA